MALFGHPTRTDECPLSGVKRTCLSHGKMSAICAPEEDVGKRRRGYFSNILDRCADLALGRGATSGSTNLPPLIQELGQSYLWVQYTWIGQIGGLHGPPARPSRF